MSGYLFGCLHFHLQDLKDHWDHQHHLFSTCTALGSLHIEACSSHSWDALYDVIIQIHLFQPEHFPSHQMLRSALTQSSESDLILTFELVRVKSGMRWESGQPPHLASYASPHPLRCTVSAEFTARPPSRIPHWPGGWEAHRYPLKELCFLEET